MTHLARTITAALMSRGSPRGTWGHQLSALLTAVILGGVLYWTRTHH